jgi:nitrogen fixation protein FixH
MNATVRWILIIVGFLISNALAMGFLVVASSTSRAEVIPDYYAKAAAYDTQIDQAAKNRALGWSIDVQAGLAINVRDASGAALDGARVHVTATSRAHARITELELTGHAGRYTAAHRASGIEDLVIVVERGGERFTAHATIE